MLESERQAYLNALGITQYVALDTIAGAPVLPVLTAEQIWPAAPTPAISAEPAQPDIAPQPPESSPAVAEQAAPISEASPRPDIEDDGSIPQLDVSKLRQEQVQPKTAPAKPVIKAQRFALAVITVPERFRLFVELTLPDAPGLSAVEHRMVSDLLGVLGHHNALDQYGAKLYRWPMVDNPRIAADSQAAREGLLGFVASAPPVIKSVFLGTKAASVISDAATGQSFALNGSALDAVACCSLSEMQHDWTRKAEAWGIIHPFLNSID